MWPSVRWGPHSYIREIFFKKNAIEDYIINSGQNLNDWDIEEAAREMRDKYDVENIDDIDYDEFITILENHEA